LLTQTFILWPIFDLLVAYRIHDFDDDGKISKSDLRAYLALAASFDSPVQEKDVRYRSTHRRIFYYISIWHICVVLNK
jgi:hypothetical protein